MSRRILLLRLSPRGQAPYLFSSARVSFRPGWLPTTRQVLARISGEDDVVIERQVSIWPFDRAPVQKAGVVSLLNGDRALDELLSIDWRDVPFEMRWCRDDEAGDVGFDYDHATLWQAGLIDGMSTTDGDRKIVLTLADPLARFDVPLQRTVYPDSYANAAARGKPRPITLGTARYVPGIERTTAETGANAFSYDYHDGAIVGVSEAFDRGDVLEPAIDWSRTSDSLGIKLANKPDRPVCAHVCGGGRTLPAQRLLVGGNFTTVGGVGRARIAAISPGGFVDAGFGPPANAGVDAVTVQSGGRVLLGGSFTTLGGVTRNRIARLLANGALDTGFNPDANGAVSALAVQADGRILVAGSFTSIGATTRNRIARLSAGGVLDATFNPNANGTISAMAVQADGRIIVGGSFTSIVSTTRNRIARLTATGALETAFNPDANGVINAIVVQGDGRIIIGGNFTTIGGVTRNRIARLNANGTLDTSFNPNANGTVSALAIQDDGRILVGGTFTTLGGTTRNRIARLNSTGSLDGSFNPNASGRVSSLSVLPDGQILIGGLFTSVGGLTRQRLARLSAGGALDTSFAPNPDMVVNAVAYMDAPEATDRLPAFFRAVCEKAQPGSYSGGSVDVAAVEALDAEAPYVLGAWLDSPVTALTLLRQALDGWLGWVTSTRDGRLTVGRIGPRNGLGHVHLGRGQIITVRRHVDTARGLATRLAGLRNHTVHSDSDIATSVTDEARADLKAEYVIKTGTTPMPAAYAHAVGAQPHPTLLQDEGQLQEAATFVATQFGAGPFTWFEVDVALAAEVADGLEMGDWIHVTHPVADLDAGRWLRLFGASIRFYRRRATLLLLDMPNNARRI